MLLLVAGLTSCNDEAFDVDSVNKQTIILLMPCQTASETPGVASAKGTFEDLQNDLDSIEAAIAKNKGLKSTRLIVAQSVSQKQCKLFEVTYDEATYKTQHAEIANYDGEKLFQTSGSIAEILQDAKQNAEALNYAMIVATHNYQASTRACQASLVNTATLAEAISESGMKMQYIFMDASYAANAEDAYNLKDATNFFIGSSSEIMSTHIPYTSIWASLNSQTPSYSTIVSSYCNYFSNTEAPFATLTAIDCRQMSNLTALMKEVNTKSIDSEMLEKIQTTDQYAPNIYYDLGDYVDSLKVSNSITNRFNDQLKLSIKSSKSTPKLLTTVSADTIDVHHYSGLVFFDPSSNSEVINKKKLSAWWQATHEQ